MKKNIKNIKIVLTIISVIILVLLLIFLFLQSYAKKDGEFVFKVYDVNENCVIEEQFDFKKGDSLLEILQSNYEVKLGEGNLNGMVLEVDQYKSDPSSNLWFIIYVNNGYSEYGIKDIVLDDGIIIELKLEQY